jgi:antitoxin component of MazEF toxin-antitoxin module
MTTKTQPITYHTTIRQHGNNTGIHVPDEVVAQLGSGKRPLVRVTLKSYTYRSAIAKMGGDYMISLSAENRQAADVVGSEAVDVTVELDLEPRTVEIPDDLQTALSEAGALADFEGSAPSKKKEFVRQVVSAKAQATRERRISKIVDTLVGK